MLMEGRLHRQIVDDYFLKDYKWGRVQKAVNEINRKTALNRSYFKFILYIKYM